MKFKTEVIQVKLTPSEKQRVKENAEKNEMSISAYVRSKIIK